jgi:isoquinoline 1-oxidoreductase
VGDSRRRTKKIDGADFVTGRHRYTPDMTRPGMLYGRVIRPPAYGAKLVSDRRGRGQGD